MEGRIVKPTRRGFLKAALALPILGLPVAAKAAAPQLIPIEFGVIAAFRNTTLWLNVPYQVSDETMAAISQECADSLGEEHGSGRIIMEFGNEHWN